MSTADSPADRFRWPSFFHRSTDPIFLLDRARRLLFANRAWERLTGFPAAEAHGLRCHRRRLTEALDPAERLAHVLAPPRDVLAGQFGRARRLLVGAPDGLQWWDLEFFPFADEAGVRGIIGKIHPLPAGVWPTTPLPDRLLALRERTAQRYSVDLLTSRLPAVGRLAEQVRLAGQIRVPVLLLGEPGVGKQTVARVIHGLGRREEAFAAVDAGRLPPGLVAEAMFGEAGLLRRPAVRTLYLREPGRLPRDLQLRLSEWLAGRAAGHDDTGPRIIAGCVADPTAQSAGEDGWAGDLAHRVSVLTIHIPPLRDRLADFPPLVDHLLDRAAGPKLDDAETAAAKIPKKPTLSAEAWEFLRAYRWPGNVRELFEVLSAAVRRAGDRSEIAATDLPAWLRQPVLVARTPVLSPERVISLKDVLAEVEKRLILDALRQARWNRSRAAELLTIWRALLLRRMKALGIGENPGTADAAPPEGPG